MAKQPRDLGDAGLPALILGLGAIKDRPQPPLSLDEGHPAARPYAKQPDRRLMVALAGQDLIGQRLLVGRSGCARRRRPAGGLGRRLAERDLIELVEVVDVLALDEPDPVLGIMPDRSEIVGLAARPALAADHRLAAVAE